MFYICAWINKHCVFCFQKMLQNKKMILRYLNNYTRMLLAPNIKKTHQKRNFRCSLFKYSHLEYIYNVNINCFLWKQYIIYFAFCIILVCICLIFNRFSFVQDRVFISFISVILQGNSHAWFIHIYMRSTKL